MGMFDNAEAIGLEGASKATRLELEVQELRQFCLTLILALRERGLSGEQCDYWWEKLGSHQDVRQ